MAERDMERAEVAKATGHVGEMEQEITLLRDDREQVSAPAGGLVTVTFRPCRDKTHSCTRVVSHWDASDTLSREPQPVLEETCRELHCHVSTGTI